MDQSKIYQIISQTLGVEENEITPEATFHEDLNAGEREISDLLLKLEQDLNIELPGKDFNKIKSVKNLLTIIEENSHEIVD